MLAVSPRAMYFPPPYLKRYAWSSPRLSFEFAEGRGGPNTTKSYSESLSESLRAIDYSVESSTTASFTYRRYWARSLVNYDRCKLFSTWLSRRLLSLAHAPRNGIECAEELFAVPFLVTIR